MSRAEIENPTARTPVLCGPETTLNDSAKLAGRVARDPVRDPRAEELQEGRRTMSGETKKCSTCGNAYARSMVIHLDGESHVFDCFECAIHALAPTCARCGCRILGHGVEARSGVYCGAHCARAAGAAGAVDHVGARAPD